MAQHEIYDEDMDYLAHERAAGDWFERMCDEHYDAIERSARTRLGKLLKRELVVLHEHFVPKCTFAREFRKLDLVDRLVSFIVDEEL